MAPSPESPGILAKDGIGDRRLLGHCVALAGLPTGAFIAAELAESISDARTEFANWERWASSKGPLTADEMRRYFVATPATKPACTQLAAFKRAQSRRYVK